MGNTKSAAIIGNGLDALQAALYLAQVGVDVKFITGVPAFTYNDRDSAGQRHFWSTVLEAVKNPRIEFFYNTLSASADRSGGPYSIKTVQKQSYINNELCTGCKKCEENCSTRLTFSHDGANVTRHAVHKPYPGNKSVPSALQIEKNAVAPCRAACPLGINVQGFVALLANNKISEAYDLINSTAPLGGILGRLCKHPCEEKCSRSKLDSPLSIRALHRFIYDNASPVEKAPQETDIKGKVAIIGSGPAGLMAAWELKKRGYEPTIFESHSTYGGMLATGIPRFRMSKEIRQREIQRLIDMGIKIRTGITVGRDVDFAYLRERGYKACFLAIGAMQNNKLNIPGEELEGVIDCMSFLISLNQMNDTFVGSNIVIIGDGNTAVDSARVAIRANKGNVKIASWTIQKELSANQDEFEEALEEGVSVEFSAFPVEILGEDGRVTGVRCRRTRLTDEVMRNGWHRPEPVPGTDFIIDADHIIIAIGQSANASQLNIEGLAIDKLSGTIMVNPLTLETSIKGIFAGGDCMRGPDNVVDAMADGRRAAESIDRYLSGKSLEKERQTETPQIAEVDLNSIVSSPATRVEMPYLDMENRKNTYEETTLGLSQQQAAGEAGRCLNCALCSECMECVKVCKANAIVHEGAGQSREIKADIIWKFPAAEIYGDSPPGELSRPGNSGGIYDFTQNGENDVKSMAAVINTVLSKDSGLVFTPSNVDEQVVLTPAGAKEKPATQAGRRGVFLCRCTGNNSSVIDFIRLFNALSSNVNVSHVAEIDQACTEAGAAAILKEIQAEGLDRAVVAACRCCNYEQPCYSCNDRRILSRKHLEKALSKNDSFIIDYVNIRELSAWAHHDDPASATASAEKMIEAVISRNSLVDAQESTSYPIRQSALFIGLSAAGEMASVTLERVGYTLRHLDLTNNSIEISGQPGDYEVKINGGEVFKAGAIIMDGSAGSSEINKLGATYTGRLLGRILSLSASADNKFSKDKYEEALSHSGLFIDDAGKYEDVVNGILLAGRVLAFLRSKRIIVPADRAAINATLCRGCRKCAEQCPLIEMQDNGKGQFNSYLEQHLCTGCGACAATCPTGAINLNRTGSVAVNASLKSLLCTVK
jgi:NADPH-dependent glutamate synthase beta subunit-like oxidoreductase/NAD-dependent dihydropyrimidine dehydrogenase PreA subunit